MLEAKYRDLEARFTALEQATVSGMPEQSIAERFHELHNRVGIVGQNVLDKIDREIGKVNTSMKAGFAEVDARFAKVDERFVQVDERLDRIESILVHIDAKLTDQQSN
ncbi:hypothetical protein ITP53_52355 [Nonomuraea sp. K274]|uniref:Uncharacterized protein n=1 Tax=Nonomuraea cypriaca TaxID=1187855 RepID=A0A931AJE2_9ACTN|nr:hypothetical protein [Nonomuraea cypriaca]MBF8194127.1 hypothetical protein [Nonomuraea cypriaca]